MKYLIYLRVSDKIKQDLETQLDYCLKFIKQRDQSCNLKYEVFSDKMTSKKPLRKREGGSKLLESMDKGDIIIAMRLDRICRKLYETTELIEVLDKKGVEILLVQQPGINNKIMLGLYAGMAEEEVKLLRKRVSEKLQSKKNRGERYSGKLPYGYGLHETHMVPIREGDKIVYKPGVLVEVPHEQEIISRMKEYSECGMSYLEIARGLNDAGYRNRSGNPFQKMSIYRILDRINQPMSNDQSHRGEELALSHR